MVTIADNLRLASNVHRGITVGLPHRLVFKQHVINVGSGAEEAWESLRKNMSSVVIIRMEKATLINVINNVKLLDLFPVTAPGL